MVAKMHLSSAYIQHPEMVEHAIRPLQILQCVLTAEEIEHLHADSAALLTIQPVGLLNVLQSHIESAVRILRDFIDIDLS